MIIAICLALINLGIIFRDGMKSLKTPHPVNISAPPPARPAVSAISKIRSGQNKKSSRPVSPDNSRVFLTLYDIECKYCAPEETDFSQEIVMDSIICSGELLKLVSTVKKSSGYPEAEYHFIEKKSDGKTALIKAKYCTGYYPIQTWNYKGLNNLFDQLDSAEIMLGMFLNRGSNNRSDNLVVSLFERVKRMKDELPDEQVYNIFIDPESSQKDSLFQIKGKNLEVLLTYYFQRRSFPVYDSIVWNDEIPLELKKEVSYNYLDYYFHKGQSEGHSKEKYFRYLMKMITEGDSEIAQKAQNYAFRQYGFATNINSTDMIDFANNVIALNPHPKIVLLALSQKTYCYLEKDETELARQIAMEALNLYDELYYYNDDDILNFQAAATCLTYMMKTAGDPRIIREYINSFENESNHPDFKNYLLFAKAVLTELTACSNDEAIAAYENVYFDKEQRIHIKGLGKNYHDYDELDGLIYVDAILYNLKNSVPETITMDEPFKVKKFLLSNDFQTLNQSGSMDIIVIQKRKIYSANSFARYNKNIWYKAKIGNDIYWIESTEKRMFGI